MSEIMIKAHDGGEFMAFVAKPKDAAKAPAIILIQEIFGVNSDMRKKCDDMAAQGFLAICPDLFWRIEPGIQLVDSEEPQLKRAFELFGLFDVEKGVEDLKTTLDFVRSHENCSGKVGTVGYCLGGKLAYMMACRSDADANVGYYGVAIETMLEEAENIKSPLMLHIAEEDEFVNKDAQQKVITALQGKELVKTYSYPGVGHAFARENGMHYNRDAAVSANARTEAFFNETLKK